MSKDIRVTVRIKNNHLCEFREKHSISQATMAKLCGLPLVKYAEIENLKTYPVEASGEWSSCAKVIADFLDKDTEEVFPEALKYIKKNKAEKIVSSVDFNRLACTSALSLEGAEERLKKEEAVDLALKCLSPRERMVLEERCGIGGGKEKTLKQVSKLLGVSGGQARLIEQRALRRLRHPNLKLKKVVEEGDDVGHLEVGYKNIGVDQWKTHHVVSYSRVPVCNEPNWPITMVEAEPESIYKSETMCKKCLAVLRAADKKNWKKMASLMRVRPL